MRTAVEGDGLVFRLADAGHAYDAVSVWSDVDLGGPVDLARVDGGWEAGIDLPELDCLEYLFDADGSMAPDAGNPDRVDGAFGPHSWLALPGYEPPAWLDTPPRPGRRIRVGDVEVWEPEGSASESLPLLMVHDGAEMDRYGRVVRWAATRPPMRVALLAPGARDERYAASPAYAAELVDEVRIELLAALPTSHRPVLLGQSLGALAALHAAWQAPDAFAGLMLQSGSFFTPELDPQESDFARFADVTAFVETVMAARETGLPPVAITCGTAEENLANNLALCEHLVTIGATVSWGQVRQGHTWTCWRDTLDPHLARLLDEVWR